jgi:hypothetical protein
MLKFGLSLFTDHGRNSGLAPRDFTTKNAENH